MSLRLTKKSTARRRLPNDMSRKPHAGQERGNREGRQHGNDGAGEGRGGKREKRRQGEGPPRPRQGLEPRGKIDKTTRHRGGRGPGDSAGDPTRKTTPRGTQAGREGGKARHEGTKSSSPDGAEDELSIAQLELSAEFLPQAAGGPPSSSS